MSIPTLLVNLAIIAFLLLPEWNSAFGRLGMEVPLFGLVLPLLLRSVAIRDMARISPVFLPAAAFALAFAVSLSFLGAPYFEGGLHTVSSWLRCALVAILGLYLGKHLPEWRIGDISRTFIYCSALVLLFGIAQRYSEIARAITFAAYWPSVENSREAWDTILASRPSSTTGRVFSFAFFAATVFLTLLAAGSERPGRFAPLVVMILSLIAMLATQTKGALLAVVLGLVVLPIGSSSRYSMAIAAIGLSLVGAAVIFVVNIVDLQRLQVFSLLFSGGFDDLSSTIASDPNVLARIDYVQVQWGIFMSQPLFGNMYLADKALFSDNLYADTMAKGGIVGLLAVLAIPVYFLRLYRRYSNLAVHRAGLSSHLFLARYIIWAGFVALVMGVTWNLFAGHRTMLLVYFLCGLLEGQWSRLHDRESTRPVNALPVAQPLAEPSGQRWQRATAQDR